MRKVAFFLGTIGCIGILSILLWTSDIYSVTAGNFPEKVTSGKVYTMMKKEEKGIPELNHELIVSMTDEFIDILVQQIDETNKVVHMDSLEELYEAFERISTRKAVEPYVGYYYTDTAEGLYILPTETPPWFVSENDYEKQISGNTVTIKQQNTNDLYGTYRIEIEFTFNGSEWKITKITH